MLACLWICRRWRDSTPRCQLQFRLDSLRICKLLLLLTFPNKFLHTLVPGRSCLKRVFAKIWRDLGVSGGLSGKQLTATSLSVSTLTSQAAASSTHLESGWILSKNHEMQSFHFQQRLELWRFHGEVELHGDCSSSSTISSVFWTFCWEQPWKGQLLSSLDYNHGDGRHSSTLIFYFWP